MKKLFINGVIAALLIGVTPAMANTSYDYATVISSVPVYQAVQVSSPQQECWNEQVASRQYRNGSSSSTPVILSTIIGGAIGNAIGHGKSNRRIGTAVGAVLGHSVGRDIVRQGNGSAVTRVENVRRCETTEQYYTQERLVGYQVRYRYHGEEYTVRMDHDPGDRIQVKVRVEPLR